MTQLRSIDPAPFVELAGVLPPLDCGQAPQLRWIEIDKLNVDPIYQRDIGRRGKKNIVRIAREFDWSRFATVVVAPAAGDRFVVIDGQHRTTAASLRGLKKVPCQIVSADRKKQAAAFAAINANVTEMSPMQVHAAKLAAGDACASRLQKVCVAAGVNVLRYPIASKLQKVGDTMAPAALCRVLLKYGEDILLPALSSITRTRDGYPGFLRAPVIKAFCAVLDTRPIWRDPAKLLPAIEQLDLRAVLKAAWEKATPGAGGGAEKWLIEAISAHLDSRFSPAPAAVKQVHTPPLAGSVVRYNGVALDLKNSRVILGGRVATLRTPRQLVLVQLLARAMPNPIGLDFLKKRVWAGDAVPSDAFGILEDMARALTAPLAAIGLTIKSTKGVGIGLRVVE